MHFAISTNMAGRITRACAVVRSVVSARNVAGLTFADLSPDADKLHRLSDTALRDGTAHALVSLRSFVGDPWQLRLHARRTATGLRWEAEDVGAEVALAGVLGFPAIQPAATRSPYLAPSEIAALRRKIVSVGMSDGNPLTEGYVMFRTQPTLAFERNLEGFITDCTDLLAERRGLPWAEIVGRHTLEVWPHMAKALANDAAAFASPGKVVVHLERDKKANGWWRARRRANGNVVSCFVENATGDVSLDAMRKSLAVLTGTSHVEHALTDNDSALVELMTDTGAEPADVARATGMGLDGMMGLWARVLRG